LRHCRHLVELLCHLDDNFSMTQGVLRITPPRLTATEPGTLLASGTTARSLVATLLRLAVVVALFLTVALSRLVLPAMLILLSGVPVALIHASLASRSWRSLSRS
jgi:hypothetical protein